MINARAQQHRVALLGFLVVLVVAWFCYRPAITGAFQLDDFANLGGLAVVEDARSAVDFILAGASGPTGRPLALLTFALQAGHWEQGPAAFLLVNILIHLCNAAVLAWCLYRVTYLGGLSRDRSALVAAATASAWVLMPLIATASLLVVQRMTTLSTLFMLLGLAAYLEARRHISEKPRPALTGMTLALVVGTSLAALCKESGLLLPVFVLVLESTLLARPASIAGRSWRIWQSLLLVFPLVILLVYLAGRFSYPDYIEVRRGFGVWERLMTEAGILWLYLQKAVVGIPGTLGIYQDPPAVSRNLLDPLTFLASISWLALGAVSVVWRRRYPLLALAVLWYLAGHMMESTVIPLELYFEHRNYLAIVGPAFAVVWLLVAGQAQLRRAAVALIPLYLLLNAYFLFSFASLWGDPSFASRYWAMHYPQSVRAVTTMASYQLAEEGPLRALQTIDRFVIENPQHAYLRIQELNLLCSYAGDKDHSQALAQLEQRLPEVDFTYTAGAMLSELFTTAARGSCNGVTADTVARLAVLLRDNDRYAEDPLYNQFHYKLLAGIARSQGDYAGTISSLKQAIAEGPSSELNMMMVTTLGAEGDFDAARKFIDDAELGRPANPVRAIRWQRDLDSLRAYLTALETRDL